MMELYFYCKKKILIMRILYLRKSLNKILIIELVSWFIWVILVLLGNYVLVVYLWRLVIKKGNCFY